MRAGRLGFLISWALTDWPGRSWSVYRLWLLEIQDIFSPLPPPLITLFCYILSFWVPFHNGKVTGAFSIFILHLPLLPVLFPPLCSVFLSPLSCSLTLSHSLKLFHLAHWQDDWKSILYSFPLDTRLSWFYFCFRFTENYSCLKYIKIVNWYKYCWLTVPSLNKIRTSYSSYLTMHDANNLLPLWLLS